MKSFFVFSLSLLLVCAISTSFAAPAAYYTWRSTLDGKTVCSQTPLGAAWEKSAGPYRDAQCLKVIRR